MPADFSAQRNSRLKLERMRRIQLRKRPFAADSDIEVMHRILRDRPTPVEEINAQVPAEVRRIIRRCLAKSPDQRYQSMKDDGYLAYAENKWFFLVGTKPQPAAPTAAPTTAK